MLSERGGRFTECKRQGNSESPCRRGVESTVSVKPCLVSLSPGQEARIRLNELKQLWLEEL